MKSATVEHYHKRNQIHKIDSWNSSLSAEQFRVQWLQCFDTVSSMTGQASGM